MTDEELPEGVRRFLKEGIQSHEELEVLLLLHRGSERAWTGEQTSAALRLPLDATEMALDALALRGLLAREPSAFPRAYRYAARTAELDGTLRELQRVHSEQQLALMRVINAFAMERLRTAAIRTFADAFILRKKKQDG